MPDWRLGKKRSPCAYPPRKKYPWNNRFDDFQKEYRTIYFAQSRLTCLREVLFDFRPDTKALTEYKKLFGEDGAHSAGVVPKEWLDKKAFIQVKAKAQDKFIAVETPGTLARIERELSVFLNLQGIKKMDVDVLRGPNRVLTQRISRLFYEEGHPGLKFNSKHDNGICYAVFEGMSKLIPISKAEPLSNFNADVATVCREWRLVPKW